MYSGWFHSIELCLCESIRDREGILVQCWSDFAVAVAQRLRIPQTFSSAVVPISGKKCQPFSPETGALLFFFFWALPHSPCTLLIRTLYVQIICNSMKICGWTSLASPSSHDWLRHDKMTKAPRQRWPKVALSASHCGVSLASKRRSTLGSSKCVSPWCSVKMNFFLRCTPHVADGEIKSYPCLPNPG